MTPDWGDDWLTLPSGGLLYLPSLRAREVRGCPSCGSTAWLIGEVGAGVACPNCVRRKPETRTFGRFDMVTLRVL